MGLRTLLGNKSDIKSDINPQKYIHELIYTYGTFYLVTSMIFIFSW